jgi:CheY-like chemotaxis protein
MRGGSHILLVDDNPHMLEFLDVRLRALGLRTTIVDNGAAALDVVRDDPPDLVVLDVAMPELNGYQACRAIKAQRPKLPVIILTGKTEKADRFWAQQCGADGFLSKPVDPQVVIQRIADELEKVR